MALDALHKLFGSEKPSGLFWLKSHAPVTEIAKLAKKHNMAFFHLEGQKIEKKLQFLNHAAVVMHFPVHFGNNWDAFEDCITDLEWIEAEGYVIYFDHTENFAQHHASELETVTELFQDAVEYWKKEGTSMLVLLSGPEPAEGVKRI